jgi:hypothetical protein
MRPRIISATILVLALCLVAGVASPPPAEAGGFRTVPGESKRAGSGTDYRFTVEVQRSIGIDRREVAATIEQTLFDRRSWIRSGRVSFRRVERRENTRILLAKPNEVDRLCHPLQTNGTYSCSIGSNVVLNVRRWRTAVPHWPSSLRNYRRMLINHEVGHRIGHGHRSCRRSGSRAAVMQQQSIGLQGCRANWWPKRSELRATAGTRSGA